MTNRTVDKRPSLPGLCATCTHARVIESDKGSRFWLCQLSTKDPRFPRYPALPVIRCGGYEGERAD